MPADGDARSEILQRIRSSMQGQRGVTPTDVRLGWDSVPRRYRRTGSLSRAERLALFEHRLRDYGAFVDRCPPADVATSMARLLHQRDARCLAVPTGFPAFWLPADLTWRDADLLDADALDRCDGVVTCATLAIAETGTLVLQTGPGQGRRAVSLVPDYHLCVLHGEDVVESVPDAFARLQATATLPTTFVSGPSATADIEMTRIKGVHGPRFLDILLVE